MTINYQLLELEAKHQQQAFDQLPKELRDHINYSPRWIDAAKAHAMWLFHDKDTKYVLNIIELYAT